MHKEIILLKKDKNQNIFTWWNKEK